VTGLIRIQRMEEQRAGRDVGRFLGKMQQDVAGIGTRLGLWVKEAKGRAMTHISKLDLNNLPKFELDRVAQSLGMGFKGWQNELKQMGEESKANVSLFLTKISRPQRALACASLSLSSQASISQRDPEPLFQLAMSTEQVSKRLDGVPVYTVSNSANEFILISDMNSQKSLGIFCFRQQDAEALLSQVGSRP
jgi:hypothetical protein